MLRRFVEPTDEEDVAITKAALEDPDCPPCTDDQMARMRPASEVVPHIVERYRRTRGQQKAPIKVPVTIRLDPDVVEYFKNTGDGWQTRINETLRKAVGIQKGADPV